MNDDTNLIKSNMNNIILLALILAALLFACKSNSVSNDEENKTSAYEKVFSTSTGDTRFEIYTATDTGLVSGYNDAGFKVFQNGQEMNSGYVKFLPRMHHPPPITSFHSTPVSLQFDYNSDKQLFLGYMSFIMVSDSFSTWYGFFNYNDVMHIDSVPFWVSTSPNAQIRSFIDNTLQMAFFVTLVAPLSPKQGPNEFKCLLHKSMDDVYFTEVDDAQMGICPWMHLMGHGSSNNINPSYTGGGIYKGQVNFNMSGEWYVYDTIHYQNRVITPANNPPKFILVSP
jgi:hypothetical protein